MKSGPIGSAGDAEGPAAGTADPWSIVGHHPGRQVGGRLTGVDPALDTVGELGPARTDQAVMKGRLQFRIAGGGRRQRPDDGPGAGRGEGLGH